MHGCHHCRNATKRHFTGAIWKPPIPGTPPVRLLIADVDGTLVTQQKLLTPRTIAAVDKLREAGIAFTITSGRPPRGMAMLIEPLKLTTPIAAFNGGLFFGRICRSSMRKHCRRMSRPRWSKHPVSGLDVWVYRGNDWFVTGPPWAACATARNGRGRISADGRGKLRRLLDDVAKIVGVSDDLEAVAKYDRCRREFGDHVWQRDRSPIIWMSRIPRRTKAGSSAGCPGK